MKWALIILALLTAPAYAQQQLPPSSVALQINSIVGQWAQELEALRQQNAQLQAKIKELEAKLPKEEPKQ